jgi:hypothetical protein
MDATPATQADPAAGFVWKDFGRFVEVHPVRSGWLVLWGRYEAAGRRKTLAGTRTYADLAGARRRLAAAVLELTRKPALAAEATALLDRHPFPPHDPAPLPAPL